MIFKIISLLIRTLDFRVSNLFENLTMLSNFFKFNKNIQVLDPLTTIWEGGTIKGFNSSWEVAVRYQRWSKNGTIKIPDELAECRENWPIRKCITHTAGLFRSGSRRAATAQGSLGYRKENRMVHEWVGFAGKSVRSFTDLPSLHEGNAGGSITNEQILTGTVVTDDPFLQCMVVQTEHQQEPEVIDYQQTGRACETEAWRNL